MSEVTYSLRFVNSSGHGIDDKKISVHYSTSHDSDYTDSDGWVTFTANPLFFSGLDVSIYVGSEFLDKIWVEDGDTHSYTL